MLSLIKNIIHRKHFVKVERAVGEFNELSKARYMKDSELRAWKEKHTIKKLTLFLSAILEKLDKNQRSKALVQDMILLLEQCGRIKEERNKDYVEWALLKYRSYFDTVESNPLTNKQREACVIDEDNNLILAGAGSGKTSVIVAKAGFIEKVGLANSDEILILAFGKKASVEVQNRIRERLDSESKIEASTFHALGLKIIGQAEGKKPSLNKVIENDEDYFRIIDSYISRFSNRSTEYARDLVDYFSNYLEPIEHPEDFETEGEYFAHLKQRDLKTLKGDYVKSREELQIANFLYCNGIEYIYEHPYEEDTRCPDYGQYRPDFFLNKAGVYLEHFAEGQNGKFPSFFSPTDIAKYKDGMKWKRRTHKKYNTKIIETFSRDFPDNTIWKKLRASLESNQVEINEIDPKSILEGIHAEEPARRLSKLIADFICLQKNSDVSLEDLVSISNSSPTAPSLFKKLRFTPYMERRFSAFIRVYQPIYQVYERELEKSKTIDFNDMINHAIKCVKKGKFRSPWKYILVDEFQDISNSKAKLIQAIVNTRKDTSLFCVGDDWQSIYRFAGSDITYTKSFSDRFGATAQTALDKTFRFNSSISDIATKFITKNPSQVKKKIDAVDQVKEPRVTVILEGKQEVKTIYRALEMIHKNHDYSENKEPHIYFIGRYKHNKPKDWENLNKVFPESRYSYDTIHASKGKEADYVIMLGLSHERYGFPGEIQSDPILEVMLPEPEDFKDAEERRLFYVGITRSKYHTFVIGPQSKPSRFIQELIQEKKHYNCAIIDENGEQVRESHIPSCNACSSGVMTLRANPNTGSSFYGCSNYPLCDNTMELCSSCSSAPLQPTGKVFRCENCDREQPQCPECHNKGYQGLLKLRSGPYGDFWGCSNYHGNQENSCRFKKNTKSTVSV